MTQHDNILIVPWTDGNRFRKIIEGGYIEYEVPPFRAIYWTTDPLPPGDCRILGRAKELMEEQWRLVVKADGNGWFDYERDNPRCINPFFSAIESGFSLLRSHGIDPENNPLILKKEGV